MILVHNFTKMLFSAMIESFQIIAFKKLEGFLSLEGLDLCSTHFSDDICINYNE